ncbi:MAG TPA: hypothetical protein VJB66_04455 [Candidatus Nanoarchaeia archaeon]|nr:hypothetical protein [Candidatus Nanoarchaeia archaeon]
MRRYIAALAVAAGCAATDTAGPLQLHAQRDHPRVTLEEQVTFMEQSLRGYSDYFSSRRHDEQAIAVAAYVDYVRDAMRRSNVQDSLAQQKLEEFHTLVQDYWNMEQGSNQTRRDKCYARIVVLAGDVDRILDAPDIKMAGPY